VTRFLPDSTDRDSASSFRCYAALTVLELAGLLPFNLLDLLLFGGIQLMGVW
jgi:hypothetical protein